MNDVNEKTQERKGIMKKRWNINQTGVVLVDVQGDFTLIRQGSLAVEKTDQPYIEKVAAATREFYSQGLKVFATQDFHPENHVSFYTSHKDKAPYDTIEIEGRSQILWPPHCVKGTRNAEVLIDNNLFTAIVQKGTRPDFDSYSGFFDDGGVKTGLDDKLKFQGLTTLIIYGLATDYCVKATAMDALECGYEVFLLENLCRGVAEETTRSALEEMKSAGIKTVFS